MASKATKRKHSDAAEDAKPRQRRRRTAFSVDQLDRLEEVFREEKFPGITLRTNLAGELAIGEDRIQVWFQNRRARWRKREVKNKPAPLPLQPGFMGGHVSQVPCQLFPHQRAFPPLPTSHDTKVTWSFPAPYGTSYGFPQQAPGHSPSLPMTSSSQFEPYFPPCSAVKQPLLFSAMSAAMKPAPIPSQADGTAERLSPDEYIAAVTLVSAFNREQ